MQNPDFYTANQPPLDQQATKTRFAGKTALVTGGASGIGYATVERFLNDGAKVVTIFDKDEAAGQRAVSYLSSQGHGNAVEFVPLDVSDREQCALKVKEVADRLGGKIDGLVNCAVYFGSRALDSEKSDWEKTFEVNVIGLSNMVQAVYMYMKHGGSIVNISSISGTRAQVERWTYSASKGAIKTVTRNMALDLAKFNIRVNSLAPGWIWSPEMAKAYPGGREDPNISSVNSFQILQRIGHTSEVASVAAFLCSRDASFITGTEIRCDGGYTAMGPERSGQDSKFAGNQK